MLRRIYYLYVVLLLAACSNPTEKTNSQEIHLTQMNWGKVNDRAIVQYTFHHSSGIELSIINYGGIVTKWVVPDRYGKLGDVVLGYDTLAGYLQNGNPYFGALIGRYANRIANGKFTLDGKDYQLARNNNGNSLHGGIYGFDKKVWDVKIPEGDSSLQLSYYSKDGEEGYPGNLRVQVVYTFTRDTALRIEYSATVEGKSTPVNLTNHSYFNLSAGEDSTILSHQLQIQADAFLPVNETLIPTGKLEPVKGTAMDFTQLTTIGKNINLVKGGYDHNWVLRKQANVLALVANLYHPVSGRGIKVFTTEPGLQFYSGNFLNGTLKYTNNGKKYVKNGALCLETQHYPDSPNQKDFPNTILHPGETFTSITVYKFYLQ
jgi:aldose 1-epimerase